MLYILKKKIKNKIKYLKKSLKTPINNFKYLKKLYISIKNEKIIIFYISNIEFLLKYFFFLKRYYSLFILWYFFRKNYKLFFRKSFLLWGLIVEYKNVLFTTDSFDFVSILFKLRGNKLRSSYIYIIFKIRNFFLNFIKRRVFVFFSLGLLKNKKIKKQLFSNQLKLLNSFFFSLFDSFEKSTVLIFNKMSKKLIIILNFIYNIFRTLNSEILKRGIFKLSLIKIKNLFRMRTLKTKKKPRKKKTILKKKQIYII